MSPKHLYAELAPLAGRIAGQPLDPELQQWLNQEHGPGTGLYQDVFDLCRAGIAEGWLCQREAGGIRYGRVFPPDPGLSGFSIDVVDMKDVAGPHHRHPLGEIDLIMPWDGTALFDDHPAGWLVYAPDSAHHPTVSQGRALILYLLPEGRIEFTRS